MSLCKVNFGAVAGVLWRRRRILDVFESNFSLRALKTTPSPITCSGADCYLDQRLSIEIP